MRLLEFNFEVNSTIEEVYKVLISVEKTKQYFSPNLNIEFKVNGLYEILFNMDAPEGERGSENMKILSMIKNEILSYTWNNPPHFKSIRNQLTVVNISLKKISEKKTNIVFVNSGYGENGEWLESITYFERAWGQIVLPRLKYVIENECNSFECVPNNLDEVKGKIVEC